MLARLPRMTGAEGASFLDSLLKCAKRSVMTSRSHISIGFTFLFSTYPGFHWDSTDD